MPPRNFRNRRQLNVAGICNKIKRNAPFLIITLLLIFGVFSQFPRKILVDDSWRRTSIYFQPEEDFKRNYADMERDFKVYMYPEQEFSPLKSGTEEYYFFYNMKQSQFLTHDPDDATLFFIPIFTNVIRVKGENYEKNMTRRMTNYVEKLIHEYPFWNRTQGSDHFFLDCKRFGTGEVLLLLNNSIRLICSPCKTTAFNVDKKVTIPKHRMDDWNQSALWGNHRNRHIPTHIITLDDSKFCIFPGCDFNGKAYAFHECVPVMVCDRHDLAFADLLDWLYFAVLIDEADGSLMDILKDISNSEFLRLYDNGIKAQQHFQWNSPPVKYDAFHTVMYQLWMLHKYNREETDSSHAFEDM